MQQKNNKESKYIISLLALFLIGFILQMIHDYKPEWIWGFHCGGKPFYIICLVARQQEIQNTLKIIERIYIVFYILATIFLLRLIILGSKKEKWEKKE